MTWQDFLEHKIGIRFFPRLLQYQSQTKTHVLNPVLESVAKDKPEKFIAALQAHWRESYEQDAPRVNEMLKKTLVLCINGRKRPLMETILPTNELLTKSAELGIQSDLPFMKLPDGALKTSDKEWIFLEGFDAICKPDLKFYFKMLETLDGLDKSRLLNEGPQGKLKSVYITIYKAIAGITKLGDGETLKVYFPSPYP